jgi:ABC-type Fe3+-hydroxamate transport system substrate-binding protein
MQLADQVGRNISVTDCPQRIISLVPSQTEYLVDIGLENQIVGITTFCVHPPHLRSQKTRVGGTKEPDLDKIRSLNPDFILANKEENRKEDLEILSKDFPVWISDVKNIDDSISMMRSIAELCKRQKKAELLITEIKEGFRKLPVFEAGTEPSAVYLIWNDPIMTVSGETFIASMLKTVGLLNPFEFESDRYPEVDLKTIQKIAPKYLFLSSEPYPFKRKQKNYFDENLPDTKVMLVDGEMFSWYGSRMVYSAEYFLNLFRTETV